MVLNYFLFPLLSLRFIFEDLLEAGSIFSIFCCPCKRCKSDLITVRIQSAFLKWLIVWGGRRGNIDVRLRRIVRGTRPHSSPLTTHIQHDTRRNRIRSVMSSSLSFSHQEKVFNLQSQLKGSVPLFWCQIQTLTSKCSKILIYSQNISFFPHPVSPICFNFHRCNSFKRKKSQLTVISLLTGLRLLFPFLRVFFQLCVVKHKKVIWEGTFRNPGITSFDQFVHDFEKMS